MTRFDPYTVDLSGTHWVEASAGTGKTHAITSLYVRAVIERHLLPSQLLVVTFTRAATAEVKDRVRKRLRSAYLALTAAHAPDDAALAGYLANVRNRASAVKNLQRALEGIDDAAIFTIHGFCQRVLEQHAFESHARFDVTLLESLDAVREQALNDSLVGRLGNAHPSVVRRFMADGGPERVAQWMRALSARPDLHVVPEATPERPLDEAIEAFRRAQNNARLDYEPERIFDILSTDASLSRAKIARRHLRARLDQAARVLDPFAEALPWPERCVTQYSYLQQCLKQGYAQAPEHRFFHACDELYDAHRRLDVQLAEASLALQRAIVSTAATLEATRKESLAVQGFDDLLLGLRAALSEREGETLARTLRDRYPLAMIDEFQDTDPVQYAIFSKIYPAAAGSLFLIGDPKQSIYSFRGADLHAYLQAAGAANLVRHDLDVNWRSDPGLVDAINRFYSGQAAPFLFPAITYHPNQPRPGASDCRDDQARPLTGLDIVFVDAGAEQPSQDRRTARRLAANHAGLWVAELLGRRVHGQPIGAQDIAILTRTNAEAEQMQASLRSLNVASSLATDTSVFATGEANQLISILRALISPNNGPAVAAALLTPGFGLQPFELLSRMRESTAWDQDIECFVTGNDLLLRHGIFAAARHLFDAYDVTVRLLQSPGGERRVTNLYHLLELAELQRVGSNLLPIALLRWLQSMREDPSEVANDARQLRIESDEHAVCITTVHRSKGLEFPYVLCPFLWADGPRAASKTEPLLYYDDGLERWVADLRGKGAPAAALASAALEQRAESLRLIYVAITRAKHAVALFVPPVKGLQHSALGGYLRQRSGSPAPLNAEVAPSELRQRLQASMLEQSSVRVLTSIGRDVRPAAATTTDSRPLSVRPVTRRIANSWVASSFSALVAGLPAHALSAEDEQGKDVDAAIVAPAPSDHDSAPARFSALPPGSASGDTLHKILECIDFVTFTPGSETIVSPLLARHGPDVERESASVQQDLVAVLEAPLLASDPSCTLRSIERRRRRSELQFSMGVGFDEHGRAERKLSAEALADALTRDATGLSEDYATSVRQLDFEPLAGYLRGFIDLVFEHNRRTYVLDYKSTSISDKIGGFTPARVAEAVAKNHYALQTAIYSLVMHRYLRWRKPDYDYDRDFGGTLVVFLRGLCPSQPPGHSIYFHRASRAAIEALDSLFATAGTA